MAEKTKSARRRVRLSQERKQETQVTALVPAPLSLRPRSGLGNTASEKHNGAKRWSINKISQSVRKPGLRTNCDVYLARRRCYRNSLGKHE